MAPHSEKSEFPLSATLRGKVAALKALMPALAIAVTGLAASAPGVATERGAHIGWTVHQPTRFIVSGVLRQDGTSDVIKPVHGIVTADDSEAAVSAFSQTTRRQYPGYTLIATLASPVPAAGTCENSI
ncbi:hypothetical protein [Paraburkholderia tuberum]|uniref:Uncharacterized protein n=1 Tax=Paraburkholderia tuberum TaxID=157910 RepID=A0A1H1KL25_9BURK|nr:hypothetical protein [Paraburkholderia tuberum]SDR62964.1 hypothetical protein SAMN05445850_8537 [Paraburkholderia tuberum]